ncbi:hypothetical protein ACIBSW_17750 [Actinoplanes sp. NPDC049668]|uniref:hypothetical protein n=1 Tax=unclassified Actinoplanes TaxID=2626549 RepID=UPI0033BF4F0A
MISLVLAMVWTRRGQALTLALLALLAVSAAVASPAYLAAADRAVAAEQIATATPAERGIVISAAQECGSATTATRSSATSAPPWPTCRASTTCTPPNSPPSASRPTM